MNILFYLSLSFQPENGGIANVSLYLSEYLKKRGHHMFFLSRYIGLGNRILHPLLPVADSALCTRNNEFVKNFLHTNKIDIIVNQNGIEPKNFEALVWGKMFGCKTITVLHSTLFGIYGINGKFVPWHRFLKRVKIYGLTNKLLLNYFRYKYGKYYEKQVLLSDAIVTLSDKFFSELKWFSCCSCANITAIPNFLTLKEANYNEVDKKKELLFVGRLSEEKRVDLLLQIWSRVCMKHTDWRLTIVGAGLENYTVKLMKYYERLNLPRVDFVGHQDPLEYYQRASIFCMTSAFEGFGLVLVEAMSCGCVPVAFNSYANVCDIIEDGKCGLLVRPFDVEKYASKISYLMDNVDVRKKFAKASVIKSEDFSPDRIVDKWEDLFQDLQNDKVTII